MDDDGLDDLDVSAQPKNTAKSTEWAVRRFKGWMAKRHLNIDLASASAEELAPILRRFYGELKANDSKALAPQTMIGIRAGIQRRLTTIRSCPFNITKDSQFEKTNNTFKAKCKLYAAKGNPRQKRKEEIAPGDLDRIHQFLASEVTATSPRRLSQAVWFILAFNLGCRGREIYRQLKKEGIRFSVDDTGKEYATIDQSVIEKNHQGGPSRDDQVKEHTRIYDCPLGPHTILGLLKLYLSKLHPDCIWLFQQCRSYATEEGPWYKNEPLGVNSLGSMMKQIGEAAGLNGTYTNHCVRATTITVLFNAGVEIQNIQSRTGHRSVQGLQPYIGNPTAEKRRDQAAILQRALGCGGDRREEEPVQLSQGQQQQQHGPTVMSQSRQQMGLGHSNAGLPTEMISGGQFHNCVFNFHVSH